MQLLEGVFFASTARTLWKKQRWVPLNVFKVWFFELKKCRPAQVFKYIPKQ